MGVMLALSQCAVNLKVHSLDPELKNRVVASSLPYLRLGFHYVQMLGNTVLTVIVPPVQLAFRQSAVRVHR